MKIIIISLVLSIKSSYADLELIKKDGHAYFYKEGTPVEITDEKVFPEGTTFSTKEKSFLKIRTKDETVITVRPKSLITILKQKKQKPRLISLMKGSLRVFVSPSSEQKRSHIINTKTAATGVRGTDFIITFNERNNISSLLTLSGETELIKREDHQIFGQKRSDTENHIDSIESELNSDFRVISKAGDVIRAYPGKRTPLPRVTISNDQFKALTKKDLPIKGKGGLLDFETGFFFPEDKKGKTIGSINKESGDYIPPKGLNLDPIEGFVAKLEKFKDLQDKLNRKIENDIFHFKDITKLSVMADVNYSFNSGSYENFYLLPRLATDITNHKFNMNGRIKHNTFKNKRYTYETFFFGGLSLSNRRGDFNIKKNDFAFFGFGIDSKRNHILFNKKAFIIYDLKAGLNFKDLNDQDDFDYFSRDIELSLGEGIYFKGLKLLKLYGTLKLFESIENKSIGIISLFNLDIDLYKSNETILKTSFIGGHRSYDKNWHNIFKYSLSLDREEILRKTDLNLTYTSRQLKKNLEKITVNDYALSIIRRKGPFLRYYSKVIFKDIHNTDRKLHHDSCSLSLGLKGLF